MASHEKSDPVKSLRDLAASKTVEELVKFDNPTMELFQLDEHVQKLIFTRFLSKYALLEKENKQLRVNARLTPYIDWQLYTQSHGIIPDPEEMIDPQSHELETNGFVLSAKFAEQWRHATEAERNGSPEETREHGLCPAVFEPLDLWSHGVGGELAICGFSSVESNEYMEEVTPCGQGYSTFEHKPLSRRISSQLLYYRLTVMFGMPPPQPMGEWLFPWQVMLQHRDGKSLLDLNDSDGQSFESFSGTKEAKEDAVELLRFLTSLKCPHPDGLVAGTS
ncbi:hypothetical protein A1O7_00428 [Cladophialophora yegresii CBS 114405]|uniref:Uncharacterized protein n=1 Tax=Cladophialophora yegresii CBS 114405 TaxID=1182544 RepID=W9W7L6_9EURO|nr:uncharacterized protein A1O7_00428 [Cladophialophora yegresii CBS 114405]EXJ64092.1 hypothetical protein A1O7_00428 [Cladophialophora yegresii CBS 114405]